MIHRNISRLISGLALLALAAVFFAPAAPAAAQTSTGSVYDLINTVNALRASRGLPPYTIDSWLMGYAQQHSDYQAATGNSTHTHSDGTTAWTNGLEENIAVGTDLLTPEYAVYTIWSDAIHMKTMVSFQTGSIGAGISVSGGAVYYTINVRPGNAVIPTGQSGGASVSLSPEKLAQTQTVAAKPIEAVITATTRPDGNVIHTVGYGQTLWNIAVAYGQKIDQIRAFNSMPTNSNSIYTGQRLLIKIRQATPVPATATSAPTKAVTATRIPPTLTPTQTLAPSNTPLPPTATATATQPAFQVASLLPDKKTGAFILIGICVIGLAFVVVSSLRK